MFSSKQFFSDALLARLTETRVNDPDFSWRAALARTRRERLAPTGKLNLLAADHPARGVTKVGSEPLAMADRRDYLARILRVLSSERVDGIMATMDILEDLSRNSLCHFFGFDESETEGRSPFLEQLKLLFAKSLLIKLAGSNLCGQF